MATIPSRCVLGIFPDFPLPKVIIPLFEASIVTVKCLSVGELFKKLSTLVHSSAKPVPSVIFKDILSFITGK